MLINIEYVQKNYRFWITKLIKDKSNYEKFNRIVNYMLKNVKKCKIIQENEDEKSLTYS